MKPSTTVRVRPIDRGGIAMSVSEAASGVVDESVDSTELAPGADGFHVEPRCRVCRDDEVRKKVNDLLASGASYAQIVRALGDDNAGLDKCDRVTIDSIRNHATRHFPVQQVARATYREIVERRAREAEIDFVNGVATALSPLAFYEVVMNEAFRRFVDGDVEVSVDTGLRAAEKLQALVDARVGQADMAAIRAEMGRVIEVVRTFIPAERWPDVQAALRGETLVSQQSSQAVEGVRMVDIDDTPDEDGN
jgi:hypothetical protein